MNLAFETIYGSALELHNPKIKPHTGIEYVFCGEQNGKLVFANNQNKIIFDGNNELFELGELYTLIEFADETF